MSALVTLYSHLGDVCTAVEVLDDAVEHAQKNKVSKSVIEPFVHSLQEVGVYMPYVKLMFLIRSGIFVGADETVRGSITDERECGL